MLLSRFNGDLFMNCINQLDDVGWRETKNILIRLISVLFHVLGWWRCLPLMSSENPITIWRHKNKKGLIWNIL